MEEEEGGERGRRGGREGGGGEEEGGRRRILKMIWRERTVGSIKRRSEVREIRKVRRGKSVEGGRTEGGSFCKRE